MGPAKDQAEWSGVSAEGRGGGGGGGEGVWSRGGGMREPRVAWRLHVSHVLFKTAGSSCKLDLVEDAAAAGASQRAPVFLPQAGLVREPAPGLFPHCARSPDHHLRPQRAQPLPARERPGAPGRSDPQPGQDRAQPGHQPFPPGPVQKPALFGLTHPWEVWQGDPPLPTRGQYFAPC